MAHDPHCTCNGCVARHFNPIPGAPLPARMEGRICFSLAWYNTKAKAALAAHLSLREGNRYNGGYFHGSPCGREPQFDYTDANGTHLYAVSY